MGVIGFHVLAGEGHKAAKLRVKQQKVAGVAKVIGVSKLKGKYEPFEAKRQLCNSFDLFLADDRVVPSLPKLIGVLPILCWRDHQMTEVVRHCTAPLCIQGCSTHKVALRVSLLPYQLCRRLAAA